MEKESIPYQIALDMKSIGFDEPCLGFYNVRGLFVPDYKVAKLQIDNLRLERCCLAPTFSQAFRWFREKYSHYAFLQPTSDLISENYCFKILDQYSGKFYSKSNPKV